MSGLRFRETTIEATDGHPLGASVLEPRSGGLPWVVVSPAVGTPHGFYRRFGRFLGEAGFGVVLYDYRGVGASAPDRLRGFEADMRDWGRRDYGGRWRGRRGGQGMRAWS